MGMSSSLGSILKTMRLYYTTRTPMSTDKGALTRLILTVAAYVSHRCQPVGAREAARLCSQTILKVIKRDTRSLDPKP